ncbi:trypco2 family protein [Streptomyces herbicida]|uniref:trypco2 family protein n=1 Tax=Streptomyces herbicida TaxID=3065675 RepID=UPI0029318D85|nr:trypco2 family protein [Streptomyces sp. NEAU-HV9]
MNMIDLADVIRDLREELQSAIRAGDGESLRFELGPIELEVSVQLEKSATTGAKVRFWVAEAGAEASARRAGTQLVRLTLQPQLAGTDRSPLVSGRAAPGEE